MALQAGEIVDGKYRILGLLGEGGMGAVYDGENLRIRRRVAIKVLHAGVADKADIVARFEREAQAAGQIGSEHIVEVLDLGNLPSGDRYMVMEFLDGESLSSRIQSRGRIHPRELCPMMIQLLQGLGAAHAAGIIHRDLKPDNVYLLRNRSARPDFIKILDFGISKFNAMSSDAMSMTRTGSVMGTPYYMSPEQAKGIKKSDNRSDLYSVGVILYEFITGQVPFSAESFNELVFKIALEPPPPIEQIVPDIDPGFASIVRKGMSREMADRFQLAQEFSDALSAWMASGAGVATAMYASPGAPTGAFGGHAGSMPGVSMTGSGPGTGAGAHPGGAMTGTAAARTPPPWANQSANGPTMPAPAGRKSQAGVVVGVVAACVALGVGAFFALRPRSLPPAAPEAAPAAMTAAAPAAITVPAPPATTPAPAAVIPAPAVSVAGSGGPTVGLVPSDASSAEAAGANGSKRGAAAIKAVPGKPGAVVPAPPAAAHPPVAAPAAPAAPTPAAPSPQSTGRKFRETILTPLPKEEPMQRPRSGNGHA